MDMLASSGTRHLLGKRPARRGLLVDLHDDSAQEVLVDSLLARGYWDGPSDDAKTRRRAIRIASASALCFTESFATVTKALRETAAQLKLQQKKWAQENLKCDVDDRGYLPKWQHNIREPQAEAERQFEQGDGAELHDGPTRPAKMRAVHSSSALAWNFFGFFQRTTTEPLLSALRVGGNLTRIAFERKVPSVVGGMDHNLDVVLLPSEAASKGATSSCIDHFQTPTTRTIASGKRTLRPATISARLPNPQMQPPGRRGPALRGVARLLVARQWKR